MKIVLLGPNGQLGHDFLVAHEAAGAPFEIVPMPRAQLDVADVSGIGAAIGDIGFDVLVNCTSYHKTDEVEDNAGQAIAVNAHAVEAMARACAARGARFFHVSTDYVFGGDGGRDRPLAEDDGIMPVNVYGASKALGETLARLSCRETTILRVASLFGVAGASGKGGNFVETMIRVGAEKGTLKVVADQFMSPTSTANVAEAMLALITRSCPTGVYHVVNSGSASWHEFASEIIRRAGIEASVLPCSTADYPTRARRPAYSVLDNGKLTDLVGPMPAWQDALDRYLVAKGHV